MADRRSLGSFQAPDLGKPQSMGIQSIMPFIGQAAMMQRLMPQSQMTQQSAPGGVATSSRDSLGIERVLPGAAQTQAGIGATGDATRSFVASGVSAPQRLISEIKSAVGAYKSVLGERKANGGDPYDAGTSIGQSYLMQHPWQRKMAQDTIGTSTLPAYKTAKSAVGGASAALYVQGNKNPGYAEGLADELMPSETSTGPQEDVDKIKTAVYTPLATQYALSKGLTTANELAQVSDYHQLDPIVKKASENGWDPNSPDVQAQVKDILKTGPIDSRYANMKFAGFDYDPEIKTMLQKHLAANPANRAKYLSVYKQETGEDYNG